eukprot:TRINITY_DN88612_c0_g1_i1.p1 TRINITY_DN88612_c0_g1~~TRINITY_DN88612_c0_g1_i1.p1  ORF type:complete len:162 (-),score=26.00 TRINITY_DN88612_c0_g1_i1:22-507(-)
MRDSRSPSRRRSRSRRPSTSRSASRSRSRSRQHGRKPHVGSGGGRKDDSEHRKVICVPQDCVGMLIGRGGENVKSLTRESGAKIDVSRDSGDREGDRTVTITGNQESVAKATRMVEEVIGRTSAADEVSEAESLPEAPPGFEPCEHEEWLYHSGKIGRAHV